MFCKWNYLNLAVQTLLTAQMLSELLNSSCNLYHGYSCLFGWKAV